MAVPALDSIIDEIQLEFNDAAGAFATDALITQAVNEGYWRGVDKLVGEDLDFFLKYTAMDMVASTGDYALTTGHIRIKKVQISYDGTNYYNANYIDIKDDDGNITYSTSKPCWTYIGSADGVQNIRIFPAPTASQAGTGYIRLYEYVYPTQLSGTDTPAIPFYGRYYVLKDYAFYKLYLRRMASGDADKAQMYLRNYLADMEELVADIHDRQSTNPRMIMVENEALDGWQTWSN